MRKFSLRLTIGLLLMLCLTVPALAGDNDASHSLLCGTWRVIWRIEDAVARPQDSDALCEIADGQLTYTDASGFHSLPLAAGQDTYAVQIPGGGTLRLSLAGDNLLKAQWQSATWLLQRTAQALPPVNPFLGDWQVLMYCIDGTPITAGDSGDFFDVRFGPYSVSTLVDGVAFSVRLCTYADGQCLIEGNRSHTICTIDDSGMMTMRQSGADVVCFLLPAASVD